jgi:hypothetical protein
MFRSTTLLFATLGLASAWGCSGTDLKAPVAGKQPINYTFDNKTEGWVLNSSAANPGFANLGAGVPDGASPPTLSFAPMDGDPGPGALRLATAFTGRNQYTAAEVAFQEWRDLTGKTLHARVRLVSGSASGVSAGLYACSEGPWYACAEAPNPNAVTLPAGTWVPLVFDLDTATPDYFNPAGVVQLGVEIYSPRISKDGGSADDATFVSRGDLVFEIDTVTD